MEVTMVKLARLAGFCMLIAAFTSHAEKLRMAQATEPTAYPGYVETQGTVYPKRQRVYRFRPGDRIYDILVSEGQGVKKGEPLFSLTNEQLIGQLVDIRDQIMAVHEAQNDVQRLNIRIDQQQNRLKHLKRRLNNEKKVAEVVTGLTNTSNLDLLQDQIIEAQDELALLGIQYEFVSRQDNDPTFLLPDLKKNQENLQRLYAQLSPDAPFDGVVRRVVDTSKPAFAGDTILELWNENGYRIEGVLTQNQLPYVKPGAKAEVFIDYFSDENLTGEVIEVKPVAITGGKNEFPLFPVIVELDQTKDTIFPGMKVSLKLFGKLP
jgi:multidrug efflux pump subunit AcrA (membrane-fusion protein)